MAVWPAAQCTIFAAVAELLQDPAAQPTPEQLLQAVLSHLEETWDSTNGVSWSEAERQISSQHLPDAWQTLVLTALQTTANLEITMHRLGCTCAQVIRSSAAAEQHNGLNDSETASSGTSPSTAGNAQAAALNGQSSRRCIHLAAHNQQYFPARPLSADEPLYTLATKCFDRANPHTHCLICRRHGIDLIKSHVFPRGMVDRITESGDFCFNLATGVRGKAQKMVYFGFCGPCDHALGPQEGKATEDLERLLLNFEDEWIVDAARMGDFFHANFSISWRIQASLDSSAFSMVVSYIDHVLPSTTFVMSVISYIKHA